MFTFFSLILFVQFIGNGDLVPEGNFICYSFHVIDFSAGFVSGVLPGHIYLMLFKNPSIKSFGIYETILLVLFFLFISTILEKLYISAPAKWKNAYAYIIFLFCTSGIIFHMFFTNIGMLDAYWLYALLVFFAFLKNKKTLFLIPVCFIFMVIVNYGSLFNYIPIMSVILLYEAASCKEKSKKLCLFVVLCISVLLTIAMLALLLYNENHNVMMSKNQLHSLFDSRGCNFYAYYDYTLYKDFDVFMPEIHYDFPKISLLESPAVPRFFKAIVNKIVSQIYLNLNSFTASKYIQQGAIKNGVVCIISGLPCVIFFNLCYKDLYMTIKDRLKRFLLFVMILFFTFSFFGSMTFSIDITRFFSHSVICIFVFFIYLLFREKEIFGGILTNRLKIIKKHYLLVFLVLSFLTRFFPFV